MDRPIALLDQSFDQLEELFASWGEPAYRARQVWDRLYRGLAASFDEMTELPKSLRNRLARETVISPLAPHTEQRSSDGQTRKILFVLPDGAQIESVLMSYARRRTACISTQAGCGMGCLFCATGQGGLQRNLTSGEIVAQVLYFARETKSEAGGRKPEIQSPTSELSNVVLMGMGEPFANYAQVMAAVRRLNDPAGFNFGARRMTVSTVGLAPGIRKLAEEEPSNQPGRVASRGNGRAAQQTGANQPALSARCAVACRGRVYRADTSPRQFRVGFDRGGERHRPSRLARWRGLSKGCCAT